ncbi:MAG: hypothetical protein RMM29_07695 [Planctomycetota bacterium]|nr:zinc-ribbon domain-containing protein [Planctomycetota bacterium]MCX8039654.1 zinc-ribbon domain-containing protein [Planctomycetota bacterium]MDW8373511.1 hypothetical protein [Planctomycetota bacterium]
MSGSPESFACPWCGARYPFKPALVGKAVRCPACKNAFQLQADGSVRRVQVAAPAATGAASGSAAAAPAPPPAAAAPKPAPPKPAASGAAAAATGAPPKPANQAAAAPASAARPPAAKPSAPPKDDKDDELDLDAGLSQAPAPPPATQPKTTTRISKRKTEQMEAMRQQLAAQLKGIQEQAAESEVAKREEKRQTDRIAKGGAKGKDAKREVQAVLTGEGEREGRALAWWIIGSAAVVLLIIALVIIANLPDSRRDALAHYAAPVPPAQNRYPALGNAVRARAWLLSAPSMPQGPAIAIDVDDADFGTERVIDLAPRAEALRALKGLQYDEALGLWLPPKERARVAEIIGQRRGTDAVKALAAARIRAIDHGELLRSLQLSEEDAALVGDLLLGQAPPEGWDIGKRIRERGELPERLVLLPFHGKRGHLLTDQGRPPYLRYQGPYRGVLLRLEGGDWPRGWRLLSLAPAR